jgi:hypothetical protein
MSVLALAAGARAACNLFPGTVNSFGSTLGAANRPFAAPGETLGFGKDQFAGSGFNGGEKPVVNQALDSILAMAVQLPALKKLGEELGVSMDSGLSEVLGKTTGKTKPETDTSEATQSSDD